MKTTYLEREDIIRWMVDQPTYRVDFWTEVRPGSQKQESYYVTEADVSEVMSWADSEAKGRRVVVYASVTRRDQPGLIRLSGVDPTRQG